VNQTVGMAAPDRGDAEFVEVVEWVSRLPPAVFPGAGECTWEQARNMADAESFKSGSTIGASPVGCGIEEDVYSQSELLTRTAHVLVCDEDSDEDMQQPSERCTGDEDMQQPSERCTGDARAAAACLQWAALFARVAVLPYLTALCAILMVWALALSGPWIDACLRDGMAILSDFSGEHVRALPSTVVWQAVGCKYLLYGMTNVAGSYLSMHLVIGFPRTRWHAAIVFGTQLFPLSLVLLSYVAMVRKVSGIKDGWWLALQGTDSWVAVGLAPMMVFFAFVVPAMLYQRWYGLTNAVRAQLFFAFSTSTFWAILHMLVLPLYGTLPVWAAVLLRGALKLYRDVMVKGLISLAAAVRLPNGQTCVTMEFLALYACCPVYFAALYLRVLQITSGDIVQTVAIEVFNTITEVQAYLKLLQGEHRITALMRRLRSLRRKRETPGLTSNSYAKGPVDMESCSRTTSATRSEIMNDGELTGNKVEREETAGTFPGEQQLGEVANAKGGLSMEQSILARVIPYSMLIESVCLFHVILAVVIWRLNFCASEEDYEAGLCEHNMYNTVANIVINLVGEIVCTDLFVVLIIAYRRRKGYRQGLYSQDLLAMWPSFLEKKVCCAISAGQVILAPACVLCLGFSYVVREPDGSTYLSVHAWEARRLVFQAIDAQT
jgi:hypothetical protein